MERKKHIFQQKQMFAFRLLISVIWVHCASICFCLFQLPLYLMCSMVVCTYIKGEHVYLSNISCFALGHYAKKHKCSRLCISWRSLNVLNLAFRKNVYIYYNRTSMACIILPIKKWVCILVFRWGCNLYISHFKSLLWIYNQKSL